MANYWMRTSDNPSQARMLYLMANLVNDVARSNKLVTSVLLCPGQRVNITRSTFEEYGHNSTHLSDRLLLAGVRLLAGWPKMPGEHCYARIVREWIQN